MALATLCGALVCTAVAQLSYKLYFVRGRRPPALLRALALFGLAQIGFFVALTQLRVGVVYMSTGAVHILVLVLSATVLHERVTRHHVVAVVLIAAGLIVYGG